jgi:HK97 family phage major capsid protein
VGDGNGKILGFQNSNALVVVAKESGQATGTLAVANLLKMLSRMLRMGGKPFWVINPDVLPQLGQLTIGNVPAWLPLSAPIEGSPWEGILLGHPVTFSEHAQSLSTQGDVNLINMDGMFVLNKAGGGIDFASSIHLFFDYNMQAFRWITRIGGQPYLSAPVTPANGSNTKSHFVTLATR